MKILKEYVYRMLEEYGSTIITEVDVMIHGKEVILEDLKENRLDCTIKKVEEIVLGKLGRKKKEIWYLVRVKDENKGRN